MEPRSPAKRMEEEEQQQASAIRFKKLHPHEFFRKFLEQGIRPDGREVMNVRRTRIASGNIGSADGSAVAKIGGTTVACGIKLEVGTPSALTPNHGRIEVSLNITPLSSPHHMRKALEYRFSHDKNTEAIAVTIKETILNAQMVHLDELCIKEGGAVWVLYVDLVCIGFSGNVTDAALLACAAALKNLKLPKTEVTEDGEVLIAEGDRKPLTIRRQVVPVSFAILDRKYIVADPTAEEEELRQGRLTVVFTSDGKLCLVQKEGGVPVTKEQMASCIGVAKAHAQKLLKASDAHQDAKKAAQ
uniref:Ribosomal RNA-processing protein 43 n=1 Tax=Lotharella oceanica TaxID=641309 RepID=A0A7S2TXE8_9EUKA|mmetsp:Transcript_34099/g.63227  ORF Transcript_34099/g.63227 Transcript_34099/m.63227 type:complete len:301 (+) Transcript_34099:19-921(+)